MKVHHDGMLCADTEVFSPNRGAVKKMAARQSLFYGAEQARLVNCAKNKKC